MITFVTGLPGHGKTLNTIFELDQLLIKSRKESPNDIRPIYYLSKEAVDSSGSGIAELNLDGWFPFQNFQAWFDLPDRSIIVIDECQYAFPAKGKNRVGDLPHYIEQFTEHRKKGFDIYLITQDAMNVDHYIRRLAGQHLHFHRPFGSQKSVRWEYQRVVNPYDKFTQKEAISRRVVKFPQKYFTAYASANAHTVKKSYPAKLFIIPALIPLIIFSAWFALRSLTHESPKPLTDFQPVSNQTIQTTNISAPVIPLAKTELKPIYDLPFFKRFVSGITDNLLSTLPDNCSYNSKIVKCLLNSRYARNLGNHYCISDTVCYALFNRIKPIKNTFEDLPYLAQK